MTENQRLQLWLKYRTKNMSLKEIKKFKGSEEFKFNRLSFLKSEREKLHVIDFMEYVDFILRAA